MTDIHLYEMSEDRLYEMESYDLTPPLLVHYNAGYR